MPLTFFSCEMVVGWAWTMLWRTASEKTMKAGLLVLDASVLRQSRRVCSSACCAAVRGAEAGLSTSLRFGRDDTAWEILDCLVRFFGGDDVWSSFGRRMARSSLSSRVRPSWVREARLKLMTLPSELVKVSVARVMRPAR